MTLATRQLLLSPAERRYVVIDTTLGQVRIRSLTERERAEYENAISDKDGAITKKTAMRIRPKLIALCVVDEEGNRLFADSDMDAIANMDGAITGVIFAACKEHCGFSEQDLEDAIKNSEGTQGD